MLNTANKNFLFFVVISLCKYIVIKLDYNKINLNQPDNEKSPLSISFTLNRLINDDIYYMFWGILLLLFDVHIVQ